MIDFTTILSYFVQVYVAYEQQKLYVDNMKKHTQEYALIVFQSEKILTSVRLAELLASSERTARRRLKEWHAYRSYNMNGGYYVLPSVAKFDSSGMWKWKDVLFSRHGNLKETLLWVLDHADAGTECR